MPKNESFVETPEGVGTVSQVNLLREQVKVRLEDAPDSPKCFHNCEICVVRNGKGKRPEGYVAPPPEELAKLRKVTPAEEPKRLSDTLDAALSGLGVNAPAAPEQQEHSGEARPRRRGRGKGGGRNNAAEAAARHPEQAAPQTAKPPKPAREKKHQGPKERPAPQQAHPAEPGENAGGEEKKQRRPRRRYRGKPKGERPQPPAQGE